MALNKSHIVRAKLRKSLLSYAHSSIRILKEVRKPVWCTQETLMHTPYLLWKAMGSSRLGMRIPECSVSTALLSVATIWYLRMSWNTNISVSMLCLLDLHIRRRTTAGHCVQKRIYPAKGQVKLQLRYAAPDAHPLPNAKRNMGERIY